jgi:excinuclease ABC subunit C
VPMRIEAFDISNLGPRHTVASMVVFEGGAPKKADYRRFVVRSLSGPDDFAAMAEVLGRRLSAYRAEHDRSPHDPARDASFAALPQLVVIAGGKGQLAAGLTALDGFTELGVAVVSLAKRLEEVYRPKQPDPVVLSRHDPALQLLQRLRDEAHRFAVDHHRQRRDKDLTRSVLDDLPGVGPARKRALLNHFGSPQRVAAASREELAAVPGLPGKVARVVHDQLHRAGDL